MARSISDATGLAAGLPGEARTHLAPQSLRHKLRPKMRLVGAGMALIVVSSGIVVGCSGGAVTPAVPIPTQAGPTRTPPPTATPVTTPTEEPGADNLHPGLPLASASNAWFATSGVCSPCHTGMEDDSGTDVSIDTAWRASMMGNAARDPFWLAIVRREVEANPESRTDLEANCTVCHMPMASVSAGLAGETPRILGDGLGDPQNELYDLAMDGVSCSLCHQIQAGNLGSASSYNGGFELDTTSIMGGRLIYGPYTVEDDLSDNMQSASGFIPIQALHVAQAEVCAPCHTAYAPPNPAATGSVALDASYFEWFYSDYRGSQACQDCHMPDADGGARVATTSEFPRSPFAQHTFAGGNAGMLRVFREFGDALGVTASGEAFEAGIRRTEELLGSGTASLTLEDVRLSGSRLTADIVIESMTGHKFPTGFPSRRAWLHLVVRDSAGRAVFESGEVTPDGAIVGDDNDEDPGKIEPHYEAIVSQDQVQIYEAVLRDTGGRPTTALTGVTGYLKDNRLLPPGFDEIGFNEHIVVHGRAEEDEDFVGGGDRVQLAIDLGAAPGPFTLEVELLFQPIGYRWLEDLRSATAPEISLFLDYFKSVNRPDLVASQTIEVGS